MPSIFEHHGIDPDEFADALAEALSAGGASADEVKWAKFGVLADSVTEADPPAWTLHREQPH